MFHENLFTIAIPANTKIQTRSYFLNHRQNYAFGVVVLYRTFEQLKPFYDNTKKNVLA